MEDEVRVVQVFLEFLILAPPLQLSDFNNSNGFWHDHVDVIVFQFNLSFTEQPADSLIHIRDQ